MVPRVLVEVAWIIIIARSGYKVINLLNSYSKPWFDILFYISIIVVGLSFLI